MESKDILALNLLRFRNDNNLSQEELAWKSGLSVKGYAQIERAEVQSSLKTLDKLSRGTGLSVLALLTHPQKWYLVVVFPLVFAGATAVYCWGFMSNDYTSDVSLYVLNKTDEQSSNITSSDTTASQQLANDIAVMAQSNRVIDATAQSLGMSTLKGYDIKVTSATTNRVITLSVTGKKPEAVAQIANELAKQTADTAVEVMELKAVNIVDAAQVPNAPSGPNRIMYTAVAFLAGLFFAVALIVLLDLIDTTVKSPEEAEELLGLPVLGRMPALKGKGN